jgi:5'-nucleotidase
MKILITNDDGAGASQLVPLIRWCRKLGDVTAVVPEYEQSGKSHGIELHKPFAVEQRQLAPDVTVLTVDSAPADCVRFAILGMHEQFDLVISGINKGFNIGTDIIYSGTVGAACEAAALNVPAIALSTSPEYYDRAIEQLDQVFDYIHRNRLMEKHSLYNVNIPEGAGPVRITHQGGPYYSDDFGHVEGVLYEPLGKCVYKDRNDLTLDTDAVMHGHISIMPLTIDKTDWPVYNKLTEML